MCEELYNYLCDHLRSKLELPTLRMIADTYQVTLPVVRDRLRILADEGKVEPGTCCPTKLAEVLEIYPEADRAVAA